jgi:hypothetical protein
VFRDILQCHLEPLRLQQLVEFQQAVEIFLLQDALGLSRNYCHGFMHRFSALEVSEVDSFACTDWSRCDHAQSQSAGACPEIQLMMVHPNN